MSLFDTQWKFDQDLAKLITFTAACGWALSLRELYRTKEQENIYRKTGASALPPNVPSDHEFSIAVDIYFRSPNGIVYTDPKQHNFDDLKKFALFWKALRPTNYWGGDWHKPFDPYHFGTKRS